jgi:uncharacterized protein involved in response to NO
MTQLLQIEPPTQAPGADPAGFALWRLGFRPFYLLGALFAAFAVPLWAALWSGGARLDTGIAPQWWHAHEMVFGFALAIVTGFLFTAVRNWTGRDTPTGARLALLCALWLLVRAVFLAGAPTLGVVLELAFLVLVAHTLLGNLVAAGNRRNYFVALMFVVLALLDLCFLAAVRGWMPALPADTLLRAALYLVVTLTFVIGGRVIPMFTLNAVRGIVQRRSVALDRAAIGVGAAAFVLDLAGSAPLVLAPAAFAAAALHAVRLEGWRPLATRGRPILWILHLSCAWIPVGFVLMGTAALGWTPATLTVHAFALGVVGGLVIGMITRTALGHTGRPLVAGRSETAMYLLVHAAALTRVAVPLLAPAAYAAAIGASAALWSAAFLLYAIVYWPRLSRPRVDGKDG